MTKKAFLYTTIIVTLLCGCKTEKEVDTSTSGDWKTNLTLRHTYRNTLIFSAVETTMPNGKREVCWTAHDRKAFVAIFQNLKLDGVPVMKERCHDILKMVEESPGGNRINMSSELSSEVNEFWGDVLKYAKKHGVTPDE